MKTILRLFLFTFTAVRLTQYVIGGFIFGSPTSFLLYVIGLSTLFFFARPLLKFVSLPIKGTGFLFMSFLLTGIATYLFTLFIPDFGISNTVISEMVFFGFILPAKHLEVIWSMVFSSLLVSVLIWFFDWICDCKRR